MMQQLGFVVCAVGFIACLFAAMSWAEHALTNRKPCAHRKQSEYVDSWTLNTGMQCDGCGAWLT